MPAALPALESLFFRCLPQGSSVLDVCCGCGHVTEELVKRGYQVTGFDVSPELVSIARARVSNAVFKVSDVRAFESVERFDAGVSTFDSLNHLLTIEDLTEALRRVRAALRPGGLFVFDMNLEEAYFADLRNWHPTVKDRQVSLVRGIFDFETSLARTDVIWFSQTGRDPDLWQRRTASVLERCYSRAEITRALLTAGWTAIEMRTAFEAGVTAELGFGRLFVSALA